MNATSMQLHTTVSIGFFPALTAIGSRFATRADIAEAFQERLITRLQDLAEATTAPAGEDEEWTLGDDPDERDLDDDDDDEWELGDGEDDDEEEDGDDDEDLDDPLG